MKHIQPTKQCYACGACVDKCPAVAISFKEDKHGFLYPVVDEQRCISCGLCVISCICEIKLNKTEFIPDAFIARSYVKDRYSFSSSGGIFGTIAEEFIKSGGVVYGAYITREEAIVVCRHIKVHKIEDLWRIQGSKYVHSNTQGVFKDVFEQLNNGNKVLFSGTSCQVAALRCYLGKEYDNLYCIDFVCHGTPPISLFRKYISYLEKKYRCVIENVSFRRKSKPGFEMDRDSFVFSIFGHKGKKCFEKHISKNASGYFKLFLSRAGYRPNCYTCPYASITKQGDITLGDFEPKEYELLKYELLNEYMYSTVLINNDKGKSLFQYAAGYFFTKQIDIETVLAHHKNLSKPSKCSKNGKKLFKLYSVLGFSNLERYIWLKGKVKEFVKHLNIIG